MTVIHSASRYAYTPAYRGRPSSSDDASGFSPSLTEQTDPDGGNSGHAVKPPVTRRVQETVDARFEFSLPYRSAFFHTSGNDSNRNTARDGSADDRMTTVGEADDADTAFDQPESDAAAAAENGADDELAASDSLPENPVDLLTSLLGG